MHAPGVFLQRLFMIESQIIMVVVRDRRGQGSIVNVTSRLFKKLPYCVAERHIFLDKTIGLRIEGLDTVKVIPCGLDDLLALSTAYSQNEDVCWACEKKKIEETKWKHWCW